MTLRSGIFGQCNYLCPMLHPGLQREKKKKSNVQAQMMAEPGPIGILRDQVNKVYSFSSHHWISLILLEEFKSR